MLVGPVLREGFLLPQEVGAGADPLFGSLLGLLPDLQDVAKRCKLTSAADMHSGLQAFKLVRGHEVQVTGRLQRLLHALGVSGSTFRVFHRNWDNMQDGVVGIQDVDQAFFHGVTSLVEPAGIRLGA